MLFLIAVILAVCFAAFLRKPLKKYPKAFYLAAVVASAAVSAFDFRGAPAFVNNYVIALFSRGAFAAGLWAAVMWTGALPNGSKPMKALMPIRGELSIFAALLTLGHNVGFGKTYFVRMFTAPASMSAQQFAAGIVSIIMLTIMLPLTVISFPKIRKKIKAKTWKNIQRSAYAFYALIYIHVMILNIPFAAMGRSGYLLNVAIYSAVFIGYAVCRIRKGIVLKKKPKNKTPLNFCSAAASFVLCASVVAAAVPKTSAAKPQNVSAGTESSFTKTSKDPIVTASRPSDTSSDVSAFALPEISSRTSSDTASESAKTEQSQYSPQTEKDSNATRENSSQASRHVPEYIYNNGVYTAFAYGYDGDIYVSVTIANDKIVEIQADSEESDLRYFDSAADAVISRIISAQNTEVDAVSGATFSSKEIMTAAANALASAKRQ